MPHVVGDEYYDTVVLLAACLFAFHFWLAHMLCVTNFLALDLNAFTLLKVGGANMSEMELRAPIYLE